MSVGSTVVASQYRATVLKEMRDKILNKVLRDSILFHPQEQINNDADGQNSTESASQEERRLNDSLSKKYDIYRSFQMSYYGYYLSLFLHLGVNIVLIFFRTGGCSICLFLGGVLSSIAGFTLLYHSKKNIDIWRNPRVNITLYIIQIVLTIILIMLLVTGHGLTIVLRVGMLRAVAMVPVMTTYSFFGPGLLEIIGDIGLFCIGYFCIDDLQGEMLFIGERKHVLVQYFITFVFYSIGSTYHTMHSKTSVYTFQGVTALVSHAIEKLTLQFKLNGLMEGDPTWWGKAPKKGESTMATTDSIKQGSSSTRKIKGDLRNSPNEKIRARSSSFKTKVKAVSPSHLPGGVFDNGTSSDDNKIQSRPLTPQDSDANQLLPTSKLRREVSRSQMSLNENLPFAATDIEDIMRIVSFTKDSSFTSKLEGPKREEEAFTTQCREVEKALGNRLKLEQEIQLRVVWDEIVARLLIDFDCSITVHNLIMTSSAESPRINQGSSYCNFKVLSMYSHVEQSRCFYSKIEKLRSLGSAEKCISIISPSSQRKVKSPEERTSGQNTYSYPKRHNNSNDKVIQSKTCTENQSFSQLTDNLCKDESTHQVADRGSSPRKLQSPQSKRHSSQVSARIPNSALENCTTTNKSPLRVDEMISVVAHDMRAPLTCIVGNLDLIEYEVKKLQSYSLLSSLIRASRSASKLIESLVSDILDSTRIAQGIFKIFPEMVDLEETIQECLETIDMAAKARGNTLKCSISGEKSIYSDKQRIKQLLLNFLTNAVKFTEKGEISISIEDKGTTKVVSIKDTGKGISKEIVAKLFEKYNSDRDSGSNAKGIGLGLFICKNIIEALGPKTGIRVES